MNILSLFDGISGAQEALRQLGVFSSNYHASELDKYAMKVTSRRFPDTIHIGDVNTVNFLKYRGVDLVIAGSPCQDLSIAKKNRKGLKGSRSSLFYKFVEAIETIQPRYWLLENVASMRDEDRHEMSQILGENAHGIDSKVLSGQRRNRLYWYNWASVSQPKSVPVSLASVLEDGITDQHKSYCLDANYFKGTHPKHYAKKSVRQLVFQSQADLDYLAATTDMTLTRTFPAFGEKVSETIAYKCYNDTINYRLLTPVECERLQGYPDFYTTGISNTQRYKCLGNSFSVPVIKHILREIV